MADSQDKKDIPARLKADADRVASELEEQYRAKLCQLVEWEMNRRFRQNEGQEDVIQSALALLYRRNTEGEFHIDSSVDLWRWLTRILRRKIFKPLKKLGNGKRDPKLAEHAEGNDLRGQSPTPEQAAITVDLMEKSLAGLHETYTPVFYMRLQNCTEQEIAAKLGCARFFCAPHVEPHSRSDAGIVGRSYRRIEIGR